MLTDVVKSKNPYIRVTLYILIALAVVTIVIIVEKIFKSYSTGVAAAGDIAGSLAIETQTGIAPDRQLICKQVATDCRAAMSVWWFTNTVYWTSDADVVTALNRLVSSSEAALTSQFFRENNGFSLAATLSASSNTFSSQANVNNTIFNSLT